MTNTEAVQKNTENGAGSSARLDRSRARLCLSAGLALDARRLAHVQSMPGGTEVRVADAMDSVAADQLEAAGVLVDETLDPVARQLLDVVNQASLMLTVELSYGADTSESTVLATPRRAVVSSPLHPDQVDYQAVSVTQLPQVLAQLIVLESPRFVGDVFLEIDRRLLKRVKDMSTGDGDEDLATATGLLTDAGLDNDQALLLIALQQDNLRRWRIRSTWSTEDGPMQAELSGLDGEEHGLWLVGDPSSVTDPDDPDTEGSPLPSERVLYNPQGHGEVMSAFRDVLPRNWLGTPLDPLLTLDSSTDT